MSKKKDSWGFSVKNLDRSARPQDDFYQYACGGWIGRAKIPPDEARWGTFDLLRKKSRESIKKILEEIRKKPAPKNSNLQKIGDYYLSGTDIAGRNRAGTKPLRKFFDMADKAKNKDDIVKISAYFRKIGIGSLWSVGAEQDLKDRKKVRLYISQGGLGLPDRDYYLKSDKKTLEIRKKYRAHIGKMHKLAFGAHTQKETDAVMEIETRLAKASMTRVEMRDFEKQYNKMALKDLQRKHPEILWEEYFKIIGAKTSEPSIVCQPLFLKEAEKMLRELDIGKWKIYLRWKIINGLAGYLGMSFRREIFDFYGKALSGTKKMKPVWESSAREIDNYLGDALGEIYVKKYFGAQAKKEINILVGNLIAAYRERIKKLGWMSAKTKKKALEKLASFKSKLGHPDKWKRYKALKISPDSYIDNHINAYKFEFEREIKKIGKRPDKKEWGMTPPTVNAYHNPLFCEIVFPAGIMQPPFFDPDADDAINYGAIGAVIGHELTHGFDDQGSKYDKNGEMKNWWEKSDRKKFDKLAKRIIAQYDKFEALPGLFINGKLTIGENIADLGGLVIAYHAYQKSLAGKKNRKISGFTPEQRFFLGAAQAEMGIARNEYLRLQISTDPHPPSKARVNLPLSNMDEFYAAFGVKKGDKMWREKRERVAVW